MSKVVAIAQKIEHKIDDVLICESCTDRNAKKIADMFNELYGENHVYWFHAKSDGYILQTFEK